MKGSEIMERKKYIIGYESLFEMKDLKKREVIFLWKLIDLHGEYVPIEEFATYMRLNKKSFMNMVYTLKKKGYICIKTISNSQGTKKIFTISEKTQNIIDEDQKEIFRQIAEEEEEDCQYI